jgi:FSR family fosmidomycin resistance protein-like MFS transporter
VGGGSISLNLTPNRATAPGIFVAPGAIGLAIGIMVGKTGQFVPWMFVAVLAACCAGIAAVRIPPVDYHERPAGENAGLAGLIVLLLLGSISIRALIGLTVELPWKADTGLLAILVLGVAGGKAAGGILADRFGWMRVAVSGLLISAPLIAFGAHSPGIAIPGVFLFNLTMAVTLTAIAAMFPGRSGYAFGLTCLALLIGALPTFTELKPILNRELLIFGIILLSTSALFGGLKLFSGFHRDEPLRSPHAPGDNWNASAPVTTSDIG